MALIKCSECNREISDKAASCPHCGCPTHASKPAGEPTGASRTGHEQQWWMSRANKTEGPYLEADITRGVRNGSISANTLVCPAGGQQWKPVALWAEFAGAVPPTQTKLMGDSFLTNSRLPAMANCICIYAILVSPILMFIGQCYTFASDSSYVSGSGPANAETGLNVLGFFGSLAVTILLLIGGLRFRALRRSGVAILKGGLWADLGLGVFQILTSVVVMASAGVQDFVQDDLTAEGMVFVLFVVLIALAALAFEIFALVWLYRKAQQLPLTEN